MNAIEIKNLTKYYGKSRGIIDLSLSVEKGDFFGFIGPNGAGKSTTIRLLLGLINATSGDANVLGMDIKTKQTEILKKVGYLSGDTTFYRGMKVKEILKLSADLRGINCKEEAEKLCKRLDLDVNKKIEQLSLGNRKKVGIVCALQHRPELYILDEPTSGLDPLIQHEFYAILQERNLEGATIFLSSHILSEVSRYCKNAAIIRDGKLLACDSVSNLSQSDIKRVTLKGATEIFESDNIRNLKTENGITSFLYGGKADTLIKELSKISFNDITITDPDLDEVFMHYYKKGDEE
ncbi:MAG: ABC transporter ATP-binding protein [Clostridia bacterium]|nr:ABC transporter ATP-binding protein [Clostridia bacterium]